MRPRIDMTGQRYGKLTVVKLAGKNKYGQRLWECICDCGAMTIAPGSSIRYGSTASCGCGQLSVLANSSRTHGMSKSRIYGIFHKMHARCARPEEKCYPSYGGRGITVCERWSGKNGFVTFLADMGEKPEGKTLDRIDTNGNYEPGNCKWSTYTEQSNNRRSSRFITWRGDTRTITQWCSLLGHSANWLAKRLKKYALDEAMEPLSQFIDTEPNETLRNGRRETMNHGEVTALLDALREELEKKLERVQSDLQETIDNLRGEVDRLNRDFESRQ